MYKRQRGAADVRHHRNLFALGLTRRQIFVAGVSGLSALALPSKGEVKERLGLRTKTDEFDYAFKAIGEFRDHLSKGPDPALTPSIRHVQGLLDEYRQADPDAERLWRQCQAFILDAGEALPFKDAFSSLDRLVASQETYWQWHGEKLHFVRAALARATLEQFAFEDGLRKGVDLSIALKRTEAARHTVEGRSWKLDEAARELLLHQVGIVKADVLMNGGDYEGAAKEIAVMRERAAHLNLPRAWTITLRHAALCALYRNDFSHARDCLDQIKAEYGDPPPVGATTRLMLVRIDAELLLADNQQGKAYERIQDYAALWHEFPFSHYRKYLDFWADRNGIKVLLPVQGNPTPTYASPIMPYFYLREFFAEP
jgi:hypothetical protein